MLEYVYHTSAQVPYMGKSFAKDFTGRRQPRIQHRLYRNATIVRGVQGIKNNLCL
jgi:hypothetical protein